MLGGMRAVSFVLETLSHFAKGVQGPPPGVPFAADAEFETDLVALCRHQRLSAMVSESFGELALPPTMSRITVARLDQESESLARVSARRLTLARQVASRLSAAGVRSALLGGVWTALYGGIAGKIRPVGGINVMIDEASWMEAVGVLREMGFVRSRIQPRLADSAHALRYHQYYAPLVMHNHDGDAVQLRFRVIDIGDPGRGNPAWERTVNYGAGEGELTTVGREDQLIQSLTSFGVDGFVGLLPVLDAGWLLARHSSDLDWDYAMRRTRERGFYPAFYFTLEHVCRLLGLGRVTERLERPPGWRRRVFHLWWRAGDADFYGETEPTAGRFSYGLIEGGGALSRILWLRRALFPRSAWVRSVYGRPANLWLRLKFLLDVRSGRRRRAADSPDSHGRVTEFNEHR